MKVSEHVCLVGLETGQADQDWFDFIFIFIAELNSAGFYSVKHSQPSTLPTSCLEVSLEELRSVQARPGFVELREAGMFPNFPTLSEPLLFSSPGW